LELEICPNFNNFSESTFDLCFTKLQEKHEANSFIYRREMHLAQRCIIYLNISAYTHPVTCEQLLIVSYSLLLTYFWQTILVAIYLYCTLFFNLGESDLNGVRA